MKRLKLMILGLIFSIALSYSANTNAATCANGYGIEVKGNSSGTYCRSRRYLNWWSANAWCDAVGMKLVSMEECIYRDESKCDKSFNCPNLNITSENVIVWTSTFTFLEKIDSINLNTGKVQTGGINTNHGVALCKSI